MLPVDAAPPGHPGKRPAAPGAEPARGRLTPERQIESWTNRACLVPLLGVPLAWMVSQVLYRWLISCDARALVRCEAQVALRGELAGLSLPADPTIRVAHDLAARFAWHPTLVAFVVVAVGASLTCWYLLHQSVIEAVGSQRARVWSVGVGAAAVSLGVVAAMLPHSWMLRTDVLEPILGAALGRETAAVPALRQVAAMFRGLATTGSCFVAAASAAALLTPYLEPARPDETAEQQAQRRVVNTRTRTRLLAEQWRRLSFSLYAGAALLVSAVVHQTSMYGWTSAFVAAAEESQDAAIRQRIAGLRSYQADSALAAATAASETARLRYTQKVATPVGDTSYLVHARHSLRLSGLRQSIVRDSLDAHRRLAEVKAAMTRVNTLVTNAITRGGGVVYSLLLALAYFPAALILMERAWELSHVERDELDDDAETRAQWRQKQGIGFSFGTQWSKALAVLSPVIASGGAMYALDFLK